jgi:peptidoglycan/LPS O-acetylase OafA/YrhL
MTIRSNAPVARANATQTEAGDVREESNSRGAVPHPTTQEPPRPTASPRHFPCFDGLRAFAAVSVLVLHTAYFSGLDRRSGSNIYTSRLEIGVSVFFLISGFLLYRPFAVSHLSRRPSPALGNFWARRLLRILPAYWLALTVITYGLHATTVGSTWQGAAIQYGLVQIYFPSDIFNGIGQAWSLCTEMSFYFFLPLYGALIGLRRRSQAKQLGRELGGLAILVAISFVFRDWSMHQPLCASNCFAHPPLTSTMSAWLPSYLDLFALGMLLAVMSAWFAERRTEPSWLRHPLVPWLSWTCAALTFWGVSQLGIPPTPIYVISPGLNLVKQTLYGVFAFFLLVPAVFGPQDRGPIRRLLRIWPIAALGVISYGIYLWHQAWIQEFLKWSSHPEFAVPFWLMTTVVLALSVGSASGSYLLLERRLLRLKGRFAWWRSSGRNQTPPEGRSQEDVDRGPALPVGPSSTA